MAKITPKQYAHAFLDALEGKKLSHEHAMENFLALIRRNGDWPKQKRIIEACEDLLRSRDEKKLVEVVSARPLTEAQRKEIHNVFHHAKIDLHERIEPELIAGVKIVVDRGEQFDGTLKHKLDTILGSV